MFKKKTELSNDKSGYYVFLPTKKEYRETDENGVKLNRSNLEREIENLRRMGEFDSKYFQKISNTVVQTFTGYPNENSECEFAINAMASIPLTAEIQVCFSGHGSPGKDGKIGMGDHDISLANEKKHYLYRVSIDELIDLLFENGFEKLKDHHLHFQFRCCNSAYVPFDILDKDKFYLKRNKPKIPEKDIEQFDKEILEKSLIGIFFQKMKENGFNHISVSGVRGFYCPSQNMPQVSSEYPAKNTFNADECTIMINSAGQVKANYLKLLAVPNIAGIDAFFAAEEKKSAYKKN